MGRPQSRWGIHSCWPRTRNVIIGIERTGDEKTSKTYARSRVSARIYGIIRNNVPCKSREFRENTNMDCLTAGVLEVMSREIPLGCASLGFQALRKKC